MPHGYTELLEQLKQRVRDSQLRAAGAANAELLRLYHSIGHDILTRQQHDGWGAKVITRLSADLRAAFPGQRGFSATSLQYMRAFAAAWPTPTTALTTLEAPALPQAHTPSPGTGIGTGNLPTAVGRLPWGHVRTLLDRLDERATRDWYAAKALEHGWSRNVLEHPPRRQGAAAPSPPACTSAKAPPPPTSPPTCPRPTPTWPSS
ncbi:DUF1016 N-terminal domain-containing protein [Kineococcus indalonis]|uniref:DUF1016 N-terminal domain-containing protein n=1 Tax=Kineococcus indalonis TaxID=2696566 RepID=UPI00196A8205|nr:DUF1016 N-terminal domain-containing protein [Kineococcus indalonis]